MTNTKVHDDVKVVTNSIDYYLEKLNTLKAVDGDENYLLVVDHHVKAIARQVRIMQKLIKEVSDEPVQKENEQKK